jgi:uridine kinase
MKPVFVNVRGCSGAGKTTLVRRLMAEHDVVPIEPVGSKRYEGY